MLVDYIASNRVRLSEHKAFCTSVFESVFCMSPSLVCVHVGSDSGFCLQLETRDPILPTGPTVDPVTAAIFARSSPSFHPASPYSSLSLSHALSTSNVQVEGDFSRNTYRARIPFSSASCLLTPFPTKFPH